MMYVRDLQGNEHPLQATRTKDSELNGNVVITFKILPTKANNPYINQIDSMWEVVDHDGTVYKIVYFKKRGEGKLLSVDLKAIPKLVDDLERKRTYERLDESLTADEYFNEVFKDTSYEYVLLDSFNSEYWEGLGEGSTRLEMFKDGLNRYGAEFKIVGNRVYLQSLVGRDTDIMYRHKLNASNIILENDANEFYTYARGYGDFSDEDGWQAAKLMREYTSPLAQIPGIGIREAPPLKDGRITKAETMDEKIKILVDESLKFSVSADIHDLSKQNYPIGETELGDRVFLIDERIDLNAEVRIVKQTDTRDWKGNLIDISLTFGSPDILDRYQSDLRTALKDISEVMSGRKKIPFSVLDEAVRQATKDLKNVQTELSIPPNGGWMAIDKNDPNKIVVFNAAGIGISTDGGKTFRNALTGSGLVADVITTGVLRAIVVDGVTINGSTFNITDNDFVLKINKDVGINIKYKGREIFSVNPTTGSVQITDGSFITTNNAGTIQIGYLGSMIYMFLTNYPEVNVELDPRNMIFHNEYEEEAWYGAEGFRFYHNNTSVAYLVFPNGVGYFYLDGDATANNWYTNSLEELKQDIESLPDGYATELINEMDILAFRYKKDAERGIIRKKVGPVIGGSYNTPTDILDPTEKSTDDHSAIYLAIKALQEANKKIDALQSEIEALKGTSS